MLDWYHITIIIPTAVYNVYFHFKVFFKIELFFQDPVDLLFNNFKINTTFILILLKKKICIESCNVINNTTFNSFSVL